MNYKYIWDNNIVLDFLLDRFKISPKIYELYIRFIKQGKIYLSTSQLHNIKFIYYRERRKCRSKDFIVEEWNKFIEKVTLIKTPSYLKKRNTLFFSDVEDYLIEESANTINALVITRDKNFINRSEIAISIDDFFNYEKDSNINKIKFLDLQSQYLSINNEIDKSIDEVIKNTAFIKGKHVEEFEKNFAEKCHAKHCIGVGNGTDAITIGLKALDIGKGDEVITVANTFIATSEAITTAGARVVFVDCHPEYYTIDWTKIEEKITDKTKAIIPVHLYGQPANMSEIMKIAKKHNLKVLEDSAQAHFSTKNGETIGSIGDVATFSFYPGKNLGAYGDGGAIVTNNDEIAKKARMWANHGRTDKYNHEFEGVNSRLDGLQAAILNVKLNHIDNWSEERRRVAAGYNDKLKDVKHIVTPKELNGTVPVYHLYVIRAEKRDELQNYLKEKGIATGIHYPIALPVLDAYKYLGHTEKDFPNSYKYQNEYLSLPIFPELSENEIDYVCESIKEFYIEK